MQYLDWQETGVCREDCECERDPKDVHGRHTFVSLFTQTCRKSHRYQHCEHLPHCQIKTKGNLKSFSSQTRDNLKVATHFVSSNTGQQQFSHAFVVLSLVVCSQNLQKHSQFSNR